MKVEQGWTVGVPINLSTGLQVLGGGVQGGGDDGAGERCGMQVGGVCKEGGERSADQLVDKEMQKPPNYSDPRKPLPWPLAPLVVCRGCLARCEEQVPIPKSPHHHQPSAHRLPAACFPRARRPRLLSHPTSWALPPWYD